MMTVIIPIVIPNAGGVLAAQAEVRRTTAACIEWMAGYQNDGASVDQMRYYAGCVNWLHPSPTDDTMLYWLKAAIFAGFLGIAIGIWWMRDDAVFRTWYGRAIAGSFAGAFVGASAVATVAALYYGAKVLVA